MADAQRRRRRLTMSPLRPVFTQFRYHSVICREDVPVRGNESVAPGVVVLRDLPVTFYTL
jgi:hypothetical protein